jgi:hypothetical protein
MKEKSAPAYDSADVTPRNDSIVLILPLPSSDDFC